MKIKKIKNPNKQTIPPKLITSRLGRSWGCQKDLVPFDPSPTSDYLTFPQEQQLSGEVLVWGSLSSLRLPEKETGL